MKNDGFLDEVETCIPALRRYARSLIQDRELADDLVQDCLERAIRRRRLWRHGAVQPWLFRILVNLFRNHYRDTRRRNETPFDEAMHARPQPADQDDRLALSDTLNAIATLPDDQREALMLVVLEGFSYVQAAEILDIPVGTLMSRIGRARQKLRAGGNGSAHPRLRPVP